MTDVDLRAGVVVTLGRNETEVISQLGRVLRTPGEWHAFGWSRFFFYRHLVSTFAGLLFPPGSEYLYQLEPNLRIHPVGGVAVPPHSDGDFGHHPAEMNVWIPMTELTDDSQRVWLRENGGDVCHPVHLGQALIFPGASMYHWNLPNTATERRSFDFRLVDASWWADTGAVTVEYGVPLSIGTYWSGPVRV